jgi:hypothetical protein
MSDVWTPKPIATPEALEEALHLQAVRHDELISLMIKAIRGRLTNEDRVALLQTAAMYQVASANILAGAFNVAVPPK